MTGTTPCSARDGSTSRDARRRRRGRRRDRPQQPRSRHPQQRSTYPRFNDANHSCATSARAVEPHRVARVSRLSAKERPSFKLPAIGGPPFPDLATAAALFRSLGHPLRLQVVLALEHETSSPTDLAQQLGVALGLSAYHVRILRADGLLELVDTRPVRGSMQSFTDSASGGTRHCACSRPPAASSTTPPKHTDLELVAADRAQGYRAVRRWMRLLQTRPPRRRA